jgi:hypothetical protein
VGLWIKVDRQRVVPASSERGTKIETCRRLSDATLLIEDRDFGHFVQPSATSREMRWDGNTTNKIN